MFLLLFHILRLKVQNLDKATYDKISTWKNSMQK